MERNKTETILKLPVPSSLTSEERQEVALKAIEFIQKRSREGKNVRGNKWSGRAGRYDPDYAKSKGVSKSGPVDLVLKDKMLNAIRYFKSKSNNNELVIGFREGSKQSNKAEGNIRGSYGNPNRAVTNKARPFLDILKKDLLPIINDVVSKREATVKTDTGDGSSFTVRID